MDGIKHIIDVRWYCARMMMSSTRNPYRGPPNMFGVNKVDLQIIEEYVRNARRRNVKRTLNVIAENIIDHGRRLHGCAAVAINLAIEVGQ